MGPRASHFPDPFITNEDHPKVPPAPLLLLFFFETGFQYGASAGLKLTYGPGFSGTQ